MVRLLSKATFKKPMLWLSWKLNLCKTVRLQTPEEWLTDVKLVIENMEKSENYLECKFVKKSCSDTRSKNR